MAHFIDKDALVAEIEKLKLCTMDEHMNFYSEAAEGEYNALCNIEHFIDSLQEEPASEDLEEVANKYGKDTFVNECMENGVCDYNDLADAFKAGAEWKEKQDQSTIELAEDHAMLAGMEKMKEQIMAKAVETSFNVSLPSGLYDKLWIKGCKEGDKLLVIKKDEL